MAFAHNGGDCLAAESRFRFCEDWLICESWNHAIAVDSWNILGGEDHRDAGMVRDVRLEIAEVEVGAIVRAADYMKRESVGRDFIGPKDFGAVYFGASVETDKPGANGVSGGGRYFD